MDIWAIADLHLAFGVPGKTMEVFGADWADYGGRIEREWRSVVKEEDLVLIAGDISWAKGIEEAKIDLEWIDRLPGTKVMIKGNHDYWWSSLSKVKKILPPSLHLIQNDVFNFGEVSIGGTRLWDSDEYHFDALVQMAENPVAGKQEEHGEQEKIFNRELERLELSLKQLDQTSTTRIAMTHYPPIGPDLHPSRASAIFEKYHVDLVVFGHLHNVRAEAPLFGEKRGVTYHLTSSDYLKFKPLKIYSSAK